MAMGWANIVATIVIVERGACVVLFLSLSLVKAKNYINFTKCKIHLLQLLTLPILCMERDIL